MIINITKIFVALFTFSILAVTAQSVNKEKMLFNISNNGKIEAIYNGVQYIEPSSIGLALVNKQILEPLSIHQKENTITVYYGPSSKVILDKVIRKDGSLRLEVIKCTKDIDAFIFGPYICPNTEKVGETIGAAWHRDGSAACIQGLNPKTLGECCVHNESKREQTWLSTISYTNNPTFTLPATESAGRFNDKYVLSCKVVNMTRPFIVHDLFPAKKNIQVEPLPAPEGNIEGAAIILTCASNPNDLLSKIGEIEVEENLPHPMIDGVWTKISPHTTDIYFVLQDGDADSQISLAKRAGVKWIYFSDPFKSWGHFEINRDKYPGGEKEFSEIITKFHENEINAGFHTLSNFLHTHDPFVTPIPDKNILAFDPTKITRSITATDTNIYIAEALNYSLKMNLSSVRIGDEIIRFSKFDKENNCLVSCERGAFGTTATAHKKGEIITHIEDGDYATFYANIKLQNEMADRIGNLIKENDLRRISFDGLDDCCRTGYGRYAVSTFVQRVYDLAGNNLISDASNGTHYTWHAHSYFNWGEPWYDYQRTGGMYNQRIRNNDYFKRNLLPRMLGWYSIFNSTGRAEATTPEVMEFILSRTIAFNAGLCIQTDIPITNISENDKLNSYCDMIKLWQTFKHDVKDIPQSVLDKMKIENSNWHLDYENGKWLLSELTVKDYDMTYCDRFVHTESRSTGYTSTDESLKQSTHRSNIVIDRSSPDESIPYITEPFHCRIRVGTPLDHGKIHNISFSRGWFDSNILLAFNVVASGGEYLEYKGGTTLFHYDKDYNLIEMVKGKGTELTLKGDNICAFTVNYDIVDELPEEKPMAPILKCIRTKQIFEFGSQHK